MSDIDFDYDSDQKISENHSKLIKDVRQLDKSQRVQKAEKTELSLNISNFYSAKSGTSDEHTVNPETWVKEFGKKGQHNDLTKEIKPTKIKPVLPKPLEKPAAARIKREIGFENIKKELGKWTGIIARNRTAASVSFPLKQLSLKSKGTNEYIKRFRLQSELQKKLAELEPEKEPEVEAEEYPLTLAEILERRKEAAKFRAQQSYKAAKAIRQNKIKSKKFHRVQRKERIKKVLKEFEELQKTDPEAALEKLGELDRARAEERMTLRHKSTGQWAKSKQIRAKYDKESRQVLAEQLSISKELTQKVNEDIDSEEEDTEEPIILPSSDKENPWLNTVKTESEVEQFISEYRKYWDKKHKLKQNQNEIIENETSPENMNNVQNLNKNVNPVVQVIEENLSGQNDLYENNDSDQFRNLDKDNCVINKKEKKQFEKNSKNKLGLKLPKSKIVKSNKSKIKAGTSVWSISSIDSTPSDKLKKTKDIILEELLDSFEDKIQEKINIKLTKAKQMLNKEHRNENKRLRKKRKNAAKDDVEKLGLKGQKGVKPIIDKPIEETVGSQPLNEHLQLEKNTNLMDLNNYVTHKSNKTEIDPTKFINMKPKLIKTSLPDETAEEREALDDNDAEDQYQIISEAFADDDIVEEFRKEKEQEIKNSQPEDVDLFLPGWGSWGGKNLKQSTRKKRRFILKAPKELPRRDENKGDVVIIEEKSSKIKKHLVSDLPFPFTNVEDFEASLRAPVSRDFVPEKTLSKLIHPAVKTKMGKIIEPMSEDLLVNINAMKKKRKIETGQQSKVKKQKVNNEKVTSNTSVKKKLKNTSEKYIKEA